MKKWELYFDKSYLINSIKARRYERGDDNNNNNNNLSL